MDRDDIREDAGGSDKPRKRFNSWKQPGRPPSPDDERSSSHGAPVRMTRRQEVNAIRCVDLHEYREDFRKLKYANLTYDDKTRMFGTGTMPIFVPLARGETLEMYEQRLREWVWREHGEHLDELQRHKNFFLERTRRIGFANANAQGDVAFDPHRTNYTPERRKRERSESRDRDYSSSRRKLERDDDRDPRHESRSHSHGHDDKKYAGRSGESSSRHSQDDKRDENRPKDSSSRQSEEPKQPRPIRICDYEEPTGDTSSTEALKAHLACGCTSCLFAAMGKMDKKLVDIEAKYTPETAGAQVIDLT